MSTNYCIKNILKVICLLQKNSVNNHSNQHLCFNTRVLSFYLNDGTLYSTSYLNTNKNYISSLFRVMEVHDNYCKVLILEQNGSTYSSTKRFLTIDLKCIGAIRCILDVNINNL